MEAKVCGETIGILTAMVALAPTALKGNGFGKNFSLAGS
jgi:hypothetical protein